MTMLISVIAVLIGLAIVLVASMRPPSITTSRFELRRRASAGDKTAAELLRKDALLGDVMSLQRVVIGLLVVCLALVTVVLLGWVVGTIMTIVFVLNHNSASRIGWLHRLAQKLYKQFEPGLLMLIDRYHSLFSLIRGRREASGDIHLESREQLIHLVEGAGDILTADEKRLIKHGLHFGSILVSSVMTPAGAIDKIAKSEMVGPLVLDDLHQTGHSSFPVIDKDIHHVVGILHIRDLLVVNSGKSSTTAEKSMEPRVHYIREDQTLDHALAAFLRSHTHLFIVVNDQHETVGLLTLEDIIEKLLGRRVADPFGSHEDLRTVASRTL
jgi:CBS domain containing-hemolysin-like protein